MSKQELSVKNVPDPIKLHPYEHKTKYYETDQMGIIHYSNYVKWMEEARMNLLDQIGLGYKQMETMEIVSPILSINIDYLSYVHFDDTVVIDTKVSEYDGFKIGIEYRMYDKVTGEDRATATSSHCFITKAGKPISMKRAYPELDTKFFEFKDEQ